jgi:hypothetical protein
VRRRAAEREMFLSGAKSEVPASTTLDRLLRYGSEGEDVKKLQNQLNKLGYNCGTADGHWGAKTDVAVRNFQRAVFGADEADGIVGARTWAKLFEEKKPKEKKPEPTGRCALHCVRKGYKEEGGCEVLALSLVPEGTANPIETIHVISGQYYAQVFRKPNTGEEVGNMEPAIQGEYAVGSVEWAGEPGEYSSSWGTGLGPVWISLDPKFSTTRGNWGIHLDAGAYSTAGCLGVKSIEDLKKVVKWFADPKKAPKKLVCDWGL